MISSRSRRLRYTHRADHPTQLKAVTSHIQRAHAPTPHEAGKTSRASLTHRHRRGSKVLTDKLQQQVKTSIMCPCGPPTRNDDRGN